MYYLAYMAEWPCKNNKEVNICHCFFILNMEANTARRNITQVYLEFGSEIGTMIYETILCI